MRKVDQRQQGASAVEFAVIAPLFIALLLSIVEFGMILYTKGMMTHAAREGARYGVVFCTPRRTAGEIETEVKKYLNLSGLTSPATVTVTGAGGNPGDILDVKVSYTYSFLVLPSDINNFTAGTLPDLNLTAETVMRME
ncbi:MAG: pilus assembly protein [Syntrophales bacterium]|nr:pilus assembly protein [Syntrophales bacterium]MDD5642815.1 pilus assembly protein [Syntrophales bacterium]